MSDQIRQVSIGVDLQLDKTSAKKLNTAVRAVVSKIAKTNDIKLKVTLDTPSLNAVKQRVRTAVSGMSKTAQVKLKIDLDKASLTTATKKVKSTVDKLSKIAVIKPSFEITAGATANLIKDVRRAAKLAGAAATVNVDVKTKTSSSSRSSGSSSRDSSDLKDLASGLTEASGASSVLFRSFQKMPRMLFQGLISSAVALSPALIAVASSAGMASLSLTAVGAASIGAAGAIAAVVGAFFGVAQALKQASTLDDQAVQSSSKNAATRLSNAKAIISAQKSIAISEKHVAIAQKGARAAQLDINKARADAKRDLQDLRDLVSGYALDEDGARIALERSRQSQAETNQDVKASALDRKEAALDVRRAEASLNDVIRDRARGVQDLKKAEKDGIEGSSRVVSAKKDYVDALEVVRSAQEAVQSSQESLNTTLAQQAEALKTVNPAAAQLKVLLDKMSPAGREMYHTLRGMKDEAEGWRRQIEAKTLPGFITFLKRVTDKGKSGASTMDLMTKKVAKLGGSLGKTTAALGEYMASKAFKKHFSKIMDDNAKAFDSLGVAFIKLLSGLMPLLSASSPLLVRFADYLAKLATRFDEWVKKIGQAKLVAFFKRAGDEMSRWWTLTGNVGRILLGVLKAAFPGGSGLVNTLADLTDRLADFVNSAKGQEKLKKFFSGFVKFLKNFDYGKAKDALKALGAMFLILKGASILTKTNPLLLLLGALAIQYPAETAKVMQGISDALGGMIRWASKNPESLIAIIGLIAALRTLNTLRGLKLPTLSSFGTLGKGGGTAAAGGTMLQAAKIQTAAGAEMLTAAKLMSGAGGLGVVGAGSQATKAGKLSGAAWKAGLASALGVGVRVIGGALAVLLAIEIADQTGLVDKEVLKESFRQTLVEYQNLDWGLLWVAAKEAAAMYLREDFRLMQESLKRTNQLIIVTWTTILNNLSVTIALKWNAIWTNARISFDSFIGWVKGKWTGFWGGLFSTFSTFGEALVETSKTVFGAMKSALAIEMDAMKIIFNSLRAIAAKPVNFLITSVYDKGLKTMVNGISTAMGLSVSLPDIKPIEYATGGVVPGSGNKDTVSAMLTPGEGILTKDEMQKLGGESGFDALRKRIGGSDLVRGKLADSTQSVANKVIAPLVMKIPGDDFFSEAAKASANVLVAQLLGKLRGDDKGTKKASGKGAVGSNVHWAMDNGGPFAPDTTAKNFSGKPELVLNNSQAKAFEERISGSDAIPTIKVFIGDKEITDIVKVEVDQSNRRTASVLGRGRRVP